MRRRRRPPAVVKVSKPQVDWRSHPVVIAAGSAAAAVLLCIAVVTQIVMPTQTAKLDIEILKQKDSIKELENKIASRKAEVLAKDKAKAELDKKHEEARRTIQTLEGQLLEARASNLFSVGNPYPIGLGQVRVGMLEAEISRAYPKEQIKSTDDDPEIITVELKNSPFERVTYYTDSVGREKRITHISFYMGYMSKYPDDFLQRRLVESLGEPDSHPEPKYFLWKAQRSINVFKLDTHGYMVMSAAYRPARWPEN